MADSLESNARTMPTIDGLDSLDDDGFVVAVSPLFEGAPRFLRRLAEARPFGAEGGLFARARAIAHRMPEADQVELIDAHPRLGAARTSVSAMSFREQGHDRADAANEPTTAAEATAAEEPAAGDLERLNDEYEAHFGFRYCVFVAGRSSSELLPAMRAALDADRAAEIRRALDAVVDIARDRHAKMTA